MIRAFLSDIAQRIITFNKLEQRKCLSRWLEDIGIPDGGRILDFGCGTGLFCNLFLKKGFEYWGYDIDERLIAFSSRLYRKGRFTGSKEKLGSVSPFDLILANCCFHHIDDPLLHEELATIGSFLADGGIFLMMDILLVEKDTSSLHNLFMKLERGRHLRTADGYRKIVEKHFSIARKGMERSHILSLKHRLNPVFNDLVVLVCTKESSGRKVIHF